MAKYVNKFTFDGQDEVLIEDVKAQNSIAEINNNIQDINEFLENIKPDYLKGKTMIVLGDSLVAGSESQGTLGKTWIELMRDEYEMTVFNYGISGSKISTGGDDSISSDMALRIDTILSNHDTCDFFILEGGANDKNKNVPLGNFASQSNDSFSGAIKNIAIKVKRKYKEKCNFLAMTTYHRYDTPNEIGLYENDYVNAMKVVCGEMSIPCFDNYNGCGISLADSPYANPPYSWADSGLASGETATHHFSDKAYEYLMPIYASFISNGYVGYAGQRIMRVGAVNDVNGLWSKKPLSNGLYIYTCTLQKTMTWSNNTYAPFWITEVQTITPPTGFVPETIYSMSISSNSQGYSQAFFNGTPSANAIKFITGRLGSNQPADASCRVNITLIGQ